MQQKKHLSFTGLIKIVSERFGQTQDDRHQGKINYSIKGAESILLLRSIYTSGDWDAYWQSHIKIESQKLYGDTLKTMNITDDYETENNKAA